MLYLFHQNQITIFHSYHTISLKQLFFIAFLFITIQTLKTEQTLNSLNFLLLLLLFYFSTKKHFIKPLTHDGL